MTFSSIHRADVEHWKMQNKTRFSSTRKQRFIEHFSCRWWGEFSKWVDEDGSSLHLTMGVLVAAMPERTYDPVGDDDCLKVGVFIILYCKYMLLFDLYFNYFDFFNYQERKWWCFLLSSIFTFIMGVVSVLLVRALASIFCRKVRTNKSKRSQTSPSESKWVQMSHCKAS